MQGTSHPWAPDLNSLVKMEDSNANLSKANDGKKKTRERAKLEENAELYADVQTGELSLTNPESGTECEMYKSTSTGKVSYYCAKKEEWNEKSRAMYNGKLPKLEEPTFFHIA